MKTLAGVDEAGLGPILGPLVVAGTAFSGPAGTDPWERLDAIVSRGRPDARQVQVADSKKVKQGKGGLARLEHTVLCFWTAWTDAMPDTIGDLFEALETDLDALARCPWYGDLDEPLPVFGDRDEIELRAHLLQRELAAHAIEPRHVAVRTIDVEEYNASIDATDNKASTHVAAFCSVIGRILDALPAGTHLVADRCGGRVHYAAPLREARPGARIRTLRETGTLSEYRIASEHGTCRMTFAVGGEERAFPTALASCFAKYVRELLIHRLNDWFAARIPDLRPTAGYYVDGHRFLTDIATFAARERLPMARLVRSR